MINGILIRNNHLDGEFNSNSKLIINLIKQSIELIDL